LRYIKLLALTIFLACSLSLSPLAARSQTKELPIPISSPLPQYPAEARAKGISGTVLVDVEVNSDGKVVEARPVMGNKILQKAALQSAHAWLFKPSAKGAGAYSVRLTFIFHDMSYVEPEKKPDFTSPYQIEIIRPKPLF
jgi:TonB family protein